MLTDSGFCSATVGRYGHQDGQTLTEYALIIMLVAIVVIGALTLLGTNLSSLRSEIASRLPG